MFPNFYAKVASIFTGVPSIMTERGDPYVTITNGIKDKILLKFINSSKGAVFQTKGASEFYSKRLQERGTVIPNAIFLTVKENSEKRLVDRDKTVVYVGRFQNIQKRMDVLLRGFKLFLNNHPDYILKMYGSGETDYVKSLISDLGIEDSVKLMGAVKNPMSKIMNDGMYVLTSDYEGIPNSLLEAMAIGLPCISTDCTPGGARLLIQDGINGQLIPRDDPKVLCDAMSKFAYDRLFAQNCGKEAQKVLERFSKDKIGKMWVDYITKIAGSR